MGVLCAPGREAKNERERQESHGGWGCKAREPLYLRDSERFDDCPQGLASSNGDSAAMTNCTALDTVAYLCYTGFATLTQGDHRWTTEPRPETSCCAIGSTAITPFATGRSV